MLLVCHFQRSGRIGHERLEAQMTDPKVACVVVETVRENFRCEQLIASHAGRIACGGILSVQDFSSETERDLTSKPRHSRWRRTGACNHSVVTLGKRRNEKRCGCCLQHIDTVKIETRSS